MTDRKIMQQALEALENGDVPTPENVGKNLDAITALRERLAQQEQEPATKAGELRAMKDEFWKQPEQEPVAWRYNHIEGIVITHRPADLDRHPDRWTALYTAPPQRKKLPPQTPCLLTQAENKMFRFGWLECEAAHGIKGENT